MTKINKKGNNKAGEIIFTDGSLVVCCGDNNCIELTVVQPEGKKRMDARSFINGYRIEKGSILE